MKYRFIVLAVGALSVGSAQAAQGMPAGCYPVKGKITNNANTPDNLNTPFPDGHTLGVAAVNFADTIKLKCALEGTPAAPPNPQDPGSIAFVHTISCDDKRGSAALPIHSKLQFNTQGSLNLNTGFFTETATPIAGSGTGLFEGVVTARSFLNIEGRVFFVPPAIPTAIDMTFTGRACYP